MLCIFSDDICLTATGKYNKGLYQVDFYIRVCIYIYLVINITAVINYLTSLILLSLSGILMHSSGPSAVSWPHPCTFLSQLPTSTQPPLHTPAAHVCWAQQPHFSHCFHHLVKAWLSTYSISTVAVALMALMCDAQWTLVGWFGDKSAEMMPQQMLRVSSPIPP